MLKLISLILLLSQLCLAQIIVNPRRALVINPPSGGAGSVANVAPTEVQTIAEDPWLDDDWVDAVNIYGTGDASIIENTYDNGDQSYVMKALTFDFSTIPAGATIVGVICTVNARSSTSSHEFDLMQILSTTRVKGGTNLASTPVTIGSTTAASYTFGASNNLWGNSLTVDWVKDADFGVAIGVISRTNNADVYIDYVLLTVHYTTE